MRRSVRATDAEDVQDRCAAIEHTADRPVLVVRSRWRRAGLVCEADVAAAVVVDDYSGQVAVMAVNDHPARAEVGGASAAALTRGKIVQSLLQVGEISGSDPLGMPGAYSSVDGPAIGVRAAVEGFVLADPSLLRREEARDLVRDFPDAEAVTRRVVTDGQLLWAGSSIRVRVSVPA